MATAPAISVRARAADARQEIVRLRTACTAWLGARRADDVEGRFTSSFDALEQVLLTALDGVEGALPAAGPPTFAGLEACRRVERGVVWVRRVWSFFKWRLDQRANRESRVAQLLAAADEVVWSCYAQAFRRDGHERPPTAPLAYIEDRFSPFAVPRVDPPPDLRFDVDSAFLVDYLKRLPIPVLGLPPSCVEHPWWLVLAAHEAGHHVQYDLLPDAALVTGFEAMLAEALGDPEKTGVAARWAGWSREIFADAWSVLTAGPAAVWALVSLEAGDEARLLRSLRAYPSTYVRVALMTGLLGALDVPAAEARRGLDPDAACAGDPVVVDGIDLRTQLKTDLAAVPAIVAMLKTRTITDGRALPALAGWSGGAFAGANEAGRWRKAWGEADPPEAVATLEAPRQAVSGAVWAWHDLERLPEDARDGARADLRERVVSVIGASHEEGLRAPDTLVATSADLGQRLTTLVLDAPEPVID